MLIIINGEGEIPEKKICNMIQSSRHSYNGKIQRIVVWWHREIAKNKV